MSASSTSSANTGRPYTQVTQQISPNDPTLRSKIVEVLAGTANGCLTELGYYPGMPQRMQELEQLNAKLEEVNAKWKSENVKLFEDNRSLAHSLQVQSEKSTKSIRSLGHQVQGLNIERARLMKVNEGLLVGQPPDARYQQLVSEYQNLQMFYQAALNEIKQLRDHIQNTNAGRYPQQSGQVVGGQPIRSPITQNGQKFRPPSNPQPQTDRIPSRNFNVQGQPQAGPSTFSRQPTEIVSVPNQQQVSGQTTPVTSSPIVHDQVQIAAKARNTASVLSDWNRYTEEYVKRPANSRPSLSISNHSHYVSSGDLPPAGHYQRPITINTSPLPPAHSPSTPISAVNSYPNLPNASPQVNPQPDIQPMPSPPMSAPHTPSPFLQNQSPNVLAQRNTLPVSGLSMAMPHIGTTPDSSDQLPKRNSLSQSPNASAEHNPFPSPNLPNPMPLFGTRPIPLEKPSKRKSFSPSEPIEALTPVHIPSSFTPPVSIVQPQISERGSLKRMNSGTPDENDTQLKKLRVEEPTPANDAGIDATGDIEEGSDDEAIEVGPDGLRLVEDCVAALIDDDEENEEVQTCKLCTARFNMGYSTIKPQPFIRATIDELALHCSTEHHDAWDSLRRVA